MPSRAATSSSVTVPGSVVLVVDEVEVLVLLDVLVDVVDVVLVLLLDVLVVVELLVVLDVVLDVLVVEVAAGMEVLVVELELLVLDVLLVDVLVLLNVLDVLNVEVVVAFGGSRSPATAGGDCPASVVPSLKKIVLRGPGVQPGCVPATISCRFVNPTGSPSEFWPSTFVKA